MVIGRKTQVVEWMLLKLDSHWWRFLPATAASRTVWVACRCPLMPCTVGRPPSWILDLCSFHDAIFTEDSSKYPLNKICSTVVDQRRSEGCALEKSHLFVVKICELIMFWAIIFIITNGKNGDESWTVWEGARLLCQTPEILAVRIVSTVFISESPALIKHYIPSFNITLSFRRQSYSWYQNNIYNIFPGFLIWQNLPKEGDCSARMLKIFSW